MFTELLLIIIELLNQGNCGDDDNIEANVGDNIETMSGGSIAGRAVFYILYVLYGEICAIASFVSNENGYAWLLGAVNGGFNLVFLRKMCFIYVSVLKYFCYIFNYISCK
ncbi:uncharacterized protein LOC136097018 isoform X1 [Hydra vulgaris]|uniref:uncharacterized protein LOC136097018 isoform X1 n=1 Tax=Hydra vulgaris TaxID=6087 RepID=UPI0032EA15EA